MLHLRIILEEEEVRFPPPLCGSRPGFMFAWQREREREVRREASDTARPEFTPQSATAERPVVNRRRRGKQRGFSRSASGKRTSQGRFQLAQRVVTAASHGGREEEVGGGRWEAALCSGKEEGQKAGTLNQPTVISKLKN